MPYLELVSGECHPCNWSLVNVILVIGVNAAGKRVRKGCENGAGHVLVPRTYSESA